MENLNSEQVKNLADAFMKMANALGNYRYENFDVLTENENLKLKQLHSETLSRTTELYTKAAVLAMEDVQASLAKIESITKETENLYNKLTNVQSVLNRATSVLTLATAIINLDANGMGDSLKGLLT